MTAIVLLFAGVYVMSSLRSGPVHQNARVARETTVTRSGVARAKF